MRTVTLPSSGVPVGKTIYISDAGTKGVSLSAASMRTDTYLNIYGRGAATLIHVGGGKWEVFSGF
jgi:hypothetical protein